MNPANANGPHACPHIDDNCTWRHPCSTPLVASCRDPKHPLTSNALRSSVHALKGPQCVGGKSCEKEGGSRAGLCRVDVVGGEAYRRGHMSDLLEEERLPHPCVPQDHEESASVAPFAQINVLNGIVSKHRTATGGAKEAGAGILHNRGV